MKYSGFSNLQNSVRVITGNFEEAWLRPKQFFELERQYKVKVSKMVTLSVSNISNSAARLFQLARICA